MLNLNINYLYLFMKKSQLIPAVITLLLSSMCPHSLWGQTAKLLTTKEDSTKLLEPSSVKCTVTSNTDGAILLHPSEANQTIKGFGFALTYASCKNLMDMGTEKRSAFLKHLYSETDGLGVSFARISIGCCDFSSHLYTCWDNAGESDFSLSSDEWTYIIPILKEILAINPKLKIIAAPWTCPPRMKVESVTNLTPHYSYRAGHLNPAYYQEYAQYFVKFINAFKSFGINIFAVSPQNEPLNGYNCASTVMPWQEEANFVRILAPAFKANGLTTKIYVWDHNYEYGNDDYGYSGQTQEDYPVKLYNAIGTDFEGSELVAGAAYHCYGGSNEELNDIYNKAPDKDLIFTEASNGLWDHGYKLSNKLMDDMNGLSIDCVLKHCSAVMVWNLMLDDKLGPFIDMPGSCTLGLGAVQRHDDGSLGYTSHYFTITHMSSVVRPGAVRINTTGYATRDLSYAAFRNPDGSLAIVLLNQNWYDLNVPLSDGEHRFSVTVPSRGIVSSLWYPSTPTFNGSQMTASDDNNVYIYKGELTTGTSYAVGGRTETCSADWYCDPDFFVRNSNGTYTFKAVTGNYEVIADFNNSAFRVFPIANGEPQTYNADGTGAVWAIGGDGIGKPSYTSNAQNWQTGVMHNMCMAEVSPKVYQLTMTVGKELSATNVNFKFFHQAGWGGEFGGTSGSTYRVTTNSSVFFIGDGTNWHDSGNIYLREGQTLTDGDTYVFRLNCSDPQNAVLSISKGNIPMFGSNELSQSGETGIYTCTASLVKNADYAITGLDGADWYYDPDFVVSNGDGTYKFRPLSGTYEVMADTNLKYLRIFPVSDGQPASYSSEGHGGVWIIGSDGIGKPSFAANGIGWQTGVEHNVCMSEIYPKMYFLTLTVGKQLNKDNVNFKLFHQPGWGGEFDGAAGKSFRITTNSTTFFVGDGTNWHDDGNIYLRDGQTLTDGDTYVFFLNCYTPSNVILSTWKTYNGVSYLPSFNYVTGVQNILTNNQGEDAYYTIQGTQVKTPSAKGIYIHNGKKVVVK